MEKKKLLLLAALGALPFNQVLANENVDKEKTAIIQMIEKATKIKLHGDTLKLIERLISENVLHIQECLPDGDEKQLEGCLRKALVIDSGKISDELHAELEKSGKVKISEASGGFILNDEFVAALFHGGAFDEQFQRKLQEEDLLGKIKAKMAAGVRTEALRDYVERPFVNGVARE